MADLTIADLLEPETAAQVMTDLLEMLARPEMPITDWNVGGVLRTVTELQQLVLTDFLGQALPVQLAGAFADTALNEGVSDEWLPLVAFGDYGLTPGLATVPQQDVTLACATGNGPYTIAAGALVLLGSDRRRWIATSGGTLSGGGTLAITAAAEGPGLARGLIVSVETPLGGVTVTAAAIRVVSSVPQYGSDAEPATALLARVLARFPDLLVEPAEDADDRLETWAKAASVEVVRTRIDPDPVYAGGIIVTLAGSTGAVTGGAVTAVQNYFNEYSGITDLNTAQNSVEISIEATGTVTVRASDLERVQREANTAWQNYLASSKIGSTVYISELVQAVMDALPGTNVEDFDNFRLNGAGDVALASNEVPVPSDDLANTLTWVTI